MHIFVQGADSIKKLISAKYSEDVKYVHSVYTLSYVIDQQMLLCNTLTGEVVLLSKKEKELFNCLPLKHDKALAELCSRGFLVPDTCDEGKRCEQLRALFMQRMGAKGIINHYNILPTTGCNARCFYCYESNIKHVNMTDETASRLVDFIASHHGGSKVRIAWFGGEPTLGIHQIDYISSGLKELNIPFDSEMVSNAYLFDQNLVKHAKSHWRLKTIQITLDGTEDVYNRVKAYIAIRDNAYQRVLRNIQYFLDEKIHVNIRLNMDEHNAENLKVLIGELTERFQGNKYMAIYVRLLKENAGFTPIIHFDDDIARLRRQYLEVQGLLEKNGWSQIWRFQIPSLRAFSCMADNPCSVQCTPDGVFSKCEDIIYEHTVGSLEDGITDIEKVKWWRERICLEECPRCVLYPSCTHLLKHCSFTTSECDLVEKKHRIQLTYNSMMRAYEKWKTENNKI